MDTSTSAKLPAIRSETRAMAALCGSCVPKSLAAKCMRRDDHRNLAPVNIFQRHSIRGSSALARLMRIIALTLARRSPCLESNWRLPNECDKSPHVSLKFYGGLSASDHQFERSADSEATSHRNVAVPTDHDVAASDVFADGKAMVADLVQWQSLTWKQVARGLSEILCSMHIMTYRSRYAEKEEVEHTVRDTARC